MKPGFDVGEEEVSQSELLQVMAGEVRLYLTDEAMGKIRESAIYLREKIEGSDEIIYGVNTGFGSLCNVVIDDADLEALQANLIRSHACGLGDEVPGEIVRLILFLKIRSFSFGYSGVSEELTNRLLSLYNLDILPILYEQGSLGASGDLAPLAHLALPLIGEGMVLHDGKKSQASQVPELTLAGSYHLKPKEGLALINGTQFSAAYLIAAYLKAYQLQHTALVSAALSIEGFDCRPEPFAAQIQNIRAHNGQPQVAAAIRTLLKDSINFSVTKTAVQDPYSFRCIPQVHGATFNALKHIWEVISGELDSVTDNPNVFGIDDAILSGGNFHAQPLALAADYLGLATAELGNISERRIYLLLSGQRGLTPFLAKTPGLESGLMIAQYTAAAIVSQSKQLATPASVDSIVSSNGQEDHVSMAANAGVKALKIAHNLERVLAIELQCAIQAMEMRGARTSPTLDAIVTDYRQRIAFLDHDRILHDDFIKTIEHIRTTKYYTEAVYL